MTTWQIKETKADLPASVYAIYFFKTPINKRDIESVKNTLRRYRKKYPYISYLFTLSNTDSKYCVKRAVRIKKQKGKPPIIVLGNKIAPHIHLSIMGDNNHSAYWAVKEIVKTLNKRFYGNCSFRGMGRKKHAKNFISYSLKQANSILKSGLFNVLLEKRKVISTQKI